MTTRRDSCAICLRPKITCICSLAVSVPSDIEVLILQHPAEVTQTKGTARLLHLCLPNSSVLIGKEYSDTYDGELLDKIIFTAKKSILLYPITTEDRSLGISEPPELNPALLDDIGNIRIIIIDGTWRKSRKILCKNPYLQTLPRLVLDELPAGQYTIRKARKPHQLSTMEAASAALAQLEGDMVKYAPLNHAFSAFNALIAAQMKR